MAVLLALTRRIGHRSAAALVSGCAALAGCSERPAPAAGERVLYRSGAFTITESSVRQGGFAAVAVTRDRIESNYQRAATEVNFKFSINGEENEHPPGTDHMIYLKPREGRFVTPIYTFGELQPPTTPEPLLAADTPEEGPVEVTFRLDMRHVLEAWRTAGVYDPPSGPPITADAFEGVYVIGNVAPLSWDFDSLVPGARVELHDPDGDGIYAVTLPFEAAFVRPQTPDGRVVWQRRRDLSRFPAYRSPQVLVDALHRLALEELLELRRDDGTLDAGGRWPGVWTRDLAWSTLLGLALVAPQEVRNGLLARVDEDGRIIQDGGTGGSWPISTDRVAWAPAAWELYAATGDRAWLRFAHDVIRRSAEADLEVALDSPTGLFRGESSFLDWREQSYPPWMDAKDIGASQALGTNVLHHAAYRVLARMARLLGEPHERWDDIAESVRRGLNEHLWQPDRGTYGAYRYGRLFPSVAPHPEMLGEALAVVLGAADGEQSRQIASRTPVVPFGVPSFWPYIPGVPPYHNAGVWPQVVGLRVWAAAEAGNPAAVEHALATLYRAAALFLTNKENWVAASGHFEGTEVNSDRFQASSAAQLATVYRVLLGIRLHEDHMELRPFVPEPYAGTRTLTDLRYRNATLTITVHGFGDTPSEIRLDGSEIPLAEIPADLTGPHTLEITLDGSPLPREVASVVRLVNNLDAPPTPQVHQAEDRIRWRPIDDASRYVVVRNGRRHGETSGTNFLVEEAGGVAEYQVQAVDDRGLVSFLSEPLRVGPADAMQFIEPARHLLESTEGGYEGAGYVRLTTERLTSLDLPVTVTAAGLYAIDVRYANGSGPINWGDKAALRTLLVDGETAGRLLLPQRGAALWDDWGYSNAIRVRLTPGAHVLTLAYRPADRNMHGAVNEALLDHARLTRVAEP